MRAFTEAEDATLAAEWAAGATVPEIARLMKRRAVEVRVRRQALGLPDRRKDTYDTDTWGGQIKPWPRFLNERSFA